MIAPHLVWALVVLIVAAGVVQVALLRIKLRAEEVRDQRTYGRELEQRVDALEQRTKATDVVVSAGIDEREKLEQRVLVLEQRTDPGLVGRRVR